MAIRLSDLIKKVPFDSEERVDRARQRFNQAVRDTLRRETALSLVRRGNYDVSGPERAQIPIRLEAGLPEGMEDIPFDDDFDLYLELSRYRPALQNMRAGGTPLPGLFQYLHIAPRGNSLLAGRDEHFPPVMGLVNDLLAEIESKDPVTRILLVSEDVLGLYRIDRTGGQQRTEIFLYWGVIALVAGWLGITVEGLTVTVLAHELAHGYSHIGADIDGTVWETDFFIQGDRSLKEGLAQHYTQLVCKRLEFRFPEALAAYEALLPRQPKPYQTHLQWQAVHSQEMIRLALLATRRKNQGALSDFLTNLELAERELS